MLQKLDLRKHKLRKEGMLESMRGIVSLEIDCSLVGSHLNQWLFQKIWDTDLGLPFILSLEYCPCLTG